MKALPQTSANSGADAVAEFALQELRRAAGKLDYFEAPRHFGLGVGNGLAVLFAQRARDPFDVLIEKLLKSEHDACAPRRRHIGPRAKCTRGALNGGVDLRGRCKRDFAHLPSVCRIKYGGTPPERSRGSTANPMRDERTG